MIPLSLHQKRINLPKETNKNSYPENYDMLMKEIEEETQMERCIMFVDWSKQYCQNKKNDYTAQDNLEIQYNPCKITNGIFHKTRTNAQICTETQNNSQNNLDKKMELEESQLLSSDYMQIKPVLSGDRNSRTDQCTRTESPEVSPHTHGQSTMIGEARMTRQ